MIYLDTDVFVVVKPLCRLGALGAFLAIISNLGHAALSEPAQSAHEPPKKTASRHDTTLEEFRSIDERKIGSRKIEFKAQKPAAGIQTGLVMLYGHILTPPFLIETKGNRLLINGVQAKPSLVRERQERTVKVPEISMEQTTIDQRIQVLRNKAHAAYSRSPDTAGETIPAFFKDYADLVRNVEWNDIDKQVCFVFVHNEARRCWRFKPYFTRSRTQREQLSNRSIEESRIRIESNLRAGLFVVIDSEEQDGVMNDFRREAREIMRDKSLSKDQKIEVLKARVLASYGLAMEIVENYADAEWAP